MSSISTESNALYRAEDYIQTLSNGSTPPSSPPSLPPAHVSRPIVVVNPRARLRGKHLYLTYPQNTMAPNTMMQKIKEHLEIDWCVICVEDHADGHPHLHVCLKQLQETTVKHAVLDIIGGGKHGNYQIPRSVDAVLMYVTKEFKQNSNSSSRFVSFNFDVVAFRKRKNTKQSNKGDVLARMIIDGKTFDDCVAVYPGYSMMHKRQLQDFEMHEEIKRQRIKLPWKDALKVLETSFLSPLNSNGILIYKWLTDNFSPDLKKTKRKFKQKQLYIHGPANLGKSSLIIFLSKFLNVYHLTKDSYCDAFKDGVYDLAVLDEFSAQKTIAFLNEWLQGGTMPLKVRFSHRTKTQNIPTIILSNLSPEDCYYNSGTTRLEPLLSRLLVINLSEPIFILGEEQ